MMIGEEICNEDSGLRGTCMLVIDASVPNIPIPLRTVTY